MKKYHLKKSIKITLLITLAIIIGIVLAIIFIPKNNKKVEEKVKELAGEIITDNVYFYDFKSKDANIGYDIIDNNIYILREKEDSYEIYKRDIYNNKTELVGSLDKTVDSFTYLEDGYIHYNHDDKTTIYNYNFEKVEELTTEELVKYKDSYITVDANIIKYNGEKYRELKEQVYNLSVTNQFIFKDTTLLLFSDLDDHSYLYDIAKDTYEKKEYDSIGKYDKGIIYYDKDDFILKDVTTGETKTYHNPRSAQEVYFNMQLKDNLMYYFGEDYLRIYDLDKNTINLFDYRLDMNMYHILLDNNLLYLVDDNLNVYVIEIDKITTKEFTNEDLDKYFDEKLNEKIDKVEKEFNIDIKVKEEADVKLDIWKQTITGEYSYDKIDEALDDIEKVFSKFGDNFFDDFYFKEYKGVRIYIVNNIQSSFPSAGQAFNYYDTFTVMVDTTSFANTLCHEIMHSMEDKAEKNNNTLFTKWDKYNPKKFKYTQDYDSYYGESTKYIAYSDTKNDIYFIDAYSKVNGLEDRARIFEYICDNSVDVINENPKLLEKAKYLRDELYKEFPKLKNTEIFSNLKE